MVTDEMVEKAADEVARQDITFANCDRGWQKRTIRAALEAALSAAEPVPTKLRMIVSHATMGQTDGEGLSTNDICVKITALRNELFKRAQSTAPSVAGWKREHDVLGELIRLLDEEPSIGDAEMSEALEKARCVWDHSHAPQEHVLGTDPKLWVSPVDLRVWQKAKAGEIWAWSENLEGQCIPLYAAHPAPSVAVKALEWIVQHPEESNASVWDVAKNALSAQVQDVAGWQPIETAPRDGTLIIVSNRYGAWLAKYLETFPTGYRPANPWFVMLLNMQHMRNPPNYIPTHWMPLPAAPAKQEG